MKTSVYDRLGRSGHAVSTHGRNVRRPCSCAAGPEVTLLDYGAGNVRSVRNALNRLGCVVKEVNSYEDILNAKKLLFPGVGSYGQAMDVLVERGYVEPLKEYIQADRPFMGICLGLQLLFNGGDENGGVEGLGIIPGRVREFTSAPGLPVPHIGWNTLAQRRPSRLLSAAAADERMYFVHSFRAVPEPENEEWVLATARYGEDFTAVVNRGNVHASQFHPEKSGQAGLQLLQNFVTLEAVPQPKAVPTTPEGVGGGLAKRVIACLDVRANDAGDLVVTKGDQYDVREKEGAQDVRNLGKPVSLCADYYAGGADEVTFLNITAFRDLPLEDLPMLEVLRESSEGVFVPLTVGGGIRGLTDASGRTYSALEVAGEYFRSGADKVSIGGDAVEAAMEFRASGVKTGETSIEQISTHYGRQAVVISIDPKRVWVAEGEVDGCQHKLTRPRTARGPAGEEACWWQCTVKGGRETRNLGAIELARAVEELGAGEILLNNIDCDGVGHGFDLDLVGAVATAVSIPVIASSGAGTPQHFSEVFAGTAASAALAAGIFHRKEVAISEVKAHMASSGIPTRL
eukprot:jgi/Ulvmu1/8485/UM044_0019.1